MAAGLFWTTAAHAEHPNDIDCAECHAAGNEVNQYNAHLLTANQEALCSSCHQNVLLVSHPTGFIPERLMPVEYPLDGQGNFSCSTCHSIHASSPNLLRNDTTGQNLCLTCHEATFFTHMADEGLSIVQVHLTLQPINPAFPMDTYSLHCAGCHDDMASVYNDAGDNGMNHSIGADYISTSDQGHYYDITELNEHMVLPYGVVSCVTCHQGYSSNHGILNVSNAGSSLCFQCHDL